MKLSDNQPISGDKKAIYCQKISIFTKKVQIMSKILKTNWIIFQLML